MVLMDGQTLGKSGTAAGLARECGQICRSSRAGAWVLNSVPHEVAAKPGWPGQLRRAGFMPEWFARKKGT